MKVFADLLKIKRAERPVVLFAIVLSVILESMIIYRYNDIFVNPGAHYWAVFLHHFRVSGFDPITYSVVTEWTAKYNVYRHPLLAFFVAPLYWLNMLLKAVTGVNCVQYVVGVAWIVVSAYAFLFFFRIVKNILKDTFPAFILSAMLFSFAHVMLAGMAPDHFILSMAMLLLVLLICQQKILFPSGHPLLSPLLTILLFVPTAGITLSNGIKVFICALFVNRRQFFRPKYLLLAVILPSLLIWKLARIEYHYMVLPQEKIQHAQKLQEKKRRQEAAARKKAEAEKTFQLQIVQATEFGDTTLLARATARLDSVRTAKPKVRRNPYGKPIAKGEFMRWTDITTSRWSSTVENLFGESILLHQDYALEDVLRHRPVIVRYRSPWQYGTEVIIVALFLAGIWCGRRNRFLWMALACSAFDMFIHLGLGFGLNEVYIMAAHWIFVIPLAIAYLLKTMKEHRKTPIMRWGYLGTLFLCSALTLFLYIYNLNIIGHCMCTT